MIAKVTDGDSVKQEQGATAALDRPEKSWIQTSPPIDLSKTDPFAPGAGSTRRYRNYSPGYNMFITISGIVIAEIFAMGVVYFNLALPFYQQVILDAGVITVIIVPLLYFLSTRPLLLHIRQRVQVERVLKSRLRIIQFANTHTLEEILQFIVDELEALTGSSAAYIHFIEPDQKTINLQTWSTNTLQHMCRVDSLVRHYPVDEAGVWADCIRLRKVVVHNDYASLPNRRGLPEGHAAIVREMSVPVIRDENVMAVLGVGNKPADYTDEDVQLVSTLADFTWDIIKQKQTADAQRASEEKFRTMVDWTYDWELWLDSDGCVVYSSPSCQRVTGFGPNEFSAIPDLLLKIIHPDDRNFYEDHQQLIHDETAGVEKLEFRILARDGTEHWIEHICRPVFGADKRYLGRRVSNRDITGRKQAEKELEDRNQKEKALTQTIHTMQLDIARDLHDTIGQNVGFLRMKLDHLREGKIRKLAEMQAEIESMATAANETYDLVRGTLAILQSNNSTDLYRLFTRYSRQIEERASFMIEYTTRGEPKSLSAPRIRQLFYIYREMLNNVEKHAQASRVTLDLVWDQDCLTLSLADNGRGFDVDQIPFGGHYGLRFMRERVEILNGTLDIQSADGAGTTITVKIPYE